MIKLSEIESVINDIGDILWTDFTLSPKTCLVLNRAQSILIDLKKSRTVRLPQEYQNQVMNRFCRKE